VLSLVKNSNLLLSALRTSAQQPAVSSSPAETTDNTVITLIDPFCDQLVAWLRARGAVKT